MCVCVQVSKQRLVVKKPKEKVPVIEKVEPPEEPMEKGTKSILTKLFYILSFNQSINLFLLLLLQMKK